MISSFFYLESADHPQLLHGQHDHGLMLLSMVIAVLASGFALQVASLARVAGTRLARNFSLLSGSITLAGSI
ncbi:MHYT domain-containing protein [Halopseudomonas salegens]|uniref:Signalling protein N terminal repeat-containing protein n=1 Tax=Halopseudomonas salegens TaxID=1434072 RepID=A0A1H2HPV7_9GAMM|nr:MHYT domain-containing protein [Halopseudomonas salegens]SDU33875.1 signalling protein N terminal repeat-containing protein [Halopseudomonas salegens]